MIKGKSLMLSMKTDGEWHTFAWATSHSIDMSAQTSELATKDNYGGVACPEVTGLSWTLKTDNLMEDEAANVALGYNALKQLAQNRDALDIQVTYFEEAVNGESYNAGNDWHKVGVGRAVLSGKAIITNLTMNAPNKEKSTWSATLTGKGAFNIDFEA